jgi:hypothetical protein
MWLPTKTSKSNNQANYRVHCLPISHRHNFSVALDATLSDATLSNATLFSNATLSNATLSDVSNGIELFRIDNHCPFFELCCFPRSILKILPLCGYTRGLV